MEETKEEDPSSIYPVLPSKNKKGKKYVELFDGFRLSCRSTARATKILDETASLRAQENWRKMVAGWATLKYARSGEVTKLEKLLHILPSEYVDAENLVRSACRFRRKALLKYLMDRFNIDLKGKSINKHGVPLVLFTVMYMAPTNENEKIVHDEGRCLKLLCDEYGADPHFIDPQTGAMLTAIWAAKNPDRDARAQLKYLVERHNVDLRHKDNYGSTVLHWAAMANNVQTVEYILEQTGFYTPLAKWATMWACKYFDWYRNMQPEIANLRSIWERRGLLGDCDRLSPMGVALVHNNKDLARRLYGLGGGGGGGGGPPAAAAARRRFAALWEDGNRDFALVCRASPECVGAVLDACVAVVGSGAGSGAGFVRTVFEVDALYGDCAVPVHRTPLAVLLETNNVDAFDHKAVKMVVSIKWGAIGVHACKIETWALMATLASFYCGYIFYHNLMARVVSAAMAVYFLHIEVREMLAARDLRTYWSDFWNHLSWLTHGAALALFACCALEQAGRLRGLDDWVGLLAGPASLLLCISAAQHLKVAVGVSRFIVMIELMMREAAYWCVLFGVFLVAFSSALYGLLGRRPDLGVTSFGEAVLGTVALFTTAEQAFPFPEEGALRAAAVAIHLLALVLVPVIYLNVLIALMTERFEAVNAVSEMSAVMELTEILLSYESVLCPAARRCALARYRPVDEFETKTVQLQLGLGGQRFTGHMRNGRVAVVQPGSEQGVFVPPPEQPHHHRQELLLAELARKVDLLLGGAAAAAGGAEARRRRGAAAARSGEAQDGAAAVHGALRDHVRRRVSLFDRPRDYSDVVATAARARQSGQNSLMGSRDRDDSQGGGSGWGGAAGEGGGGGGSASPHQGEEEGGEQEPEPWRAKYLALLRRAERQRAAAKIQARVRGWGARARLRAEVERRRRVPSRSGGSAGGGAPPHLLLPPGGGLLPRGAAETAGSSTKGVRQGGGSVRTTSSSSKRGNFY